MAQAMVSAAQKPCGEEEAVPAIGITASGTGCVERSNPCNLPEDSRWEAIPLCQDQAEWLEEMAAFHRLSEGSLTTDPPLALSPGLGDLRGLTVGGCLALQRLEEAANREPPKSKRQIFLSVRCRRCLQHSRGGAKEECLVRLPQAHWTWLEGVQARCKHPTVGKTLRIIVDFYKPLCQDDEIFASSLFAKRGMLSPSTSGSSSSELSPSRGMCSPSSFESSESTREGTPRSDGGSDGSSLHSSSGYEHEALTLARLSAY